MKLQILWKDLIEQTREHSASYELLWRALVQSKPTAAPERLTYASLYLSPSNQSSSAWRFWWHENKCYHGTKSFLGLFSVPSRVGAKGWWAGAESVIKNSFILKTRSQPNKLLFVPENDRHGWWFYLICILPNSWDHWAIYISGLEKLWNV